MPVEEQLEEITNIACECCGFMTVYSSGFVYLDDEEEMPDMEYVARWTDGKGDHGIALLVYIEAFEKYASVMFDFEQHAFTVINPADNDWGDVEESELLERDNIIGTEHADILFKALDEILLKDKSLMKFAEMVMVDTGEDE
ncbi:MAG: hypothetical protein QMC23_02360 [Rubritalea sp.]|jgi:hypothetical protein|tara:strand:- start:105 stop:530 length:426 start_codon:yes stop_codon:yes gene_type:complete